MQYSFASRAQTLLSSPLRDIRELAKRDSFISLAERAAGRRVIPFAFSGGGGDIGAVRGPARAAVR
ncbi:Uncharacterised protein [Actinobacillus pleuropneumoniae]|nr:Uncharacterised protein [Actinobacillus pleuropneumoniae]